MVKLPESEINKEIGQKTQTSLEGYIHKVTQAHTNSTDTFAVVTNPNQPLFELNGTIIIPLPAKKCPENFAESFQQNLIRLDSKTKIDFAGSVTVGFISTKNCVRIILSQNEINIQLGAHNKHAAVDIADIAKIGIAATQAITQNSVQKSVLLGVFSDDKLLQLTQSLLKEHGFLIESNAEKKEEPEPSKTDADISEETAPPKSKSLHFFSSTKKRKTKKDKD